MSGQRRQFYNSNNTSRNNQQTQWQQSRNQPNQTFRYVRRGQWRRQENEVEYEPQEQNNQQIDLDDNLEEDNRVQRWRNQNQVDTYCEQEERCAKRQQCPYKHDNFYWIYVKDRQHLQIKSSTQMQACIQTAKTLQLPSSIEILMDKVFEKPISFKNMPAEEKQFNYDLFEEGYHDYFYQLHCTIQKGIKASTWKDNSAFVEALSKKIIPQYQGVSINQLNNMFLQFITTVLNNTMKKLSLKLDKKGLTLEILKYNLQEAQEAFEKLKNLEVVCLDMTVFEQELQNIDDTWDLFEILEQLPQLKNLELIIRQDQVFSKPLGQNLRQNVNIYLQVIFKPDKSFSQNLLRFLTTSQAFHLTFNWNYYPPSMLNLQYIYTFINQNVRQLKSLFLKQQSFKLDIEESKLRKVKEIVDLASKHVENLEIDNAFLDYFLNQEDPRWSLVTSMCLDLANSYKNDLHVHISAENFLASEEIFSSGKFNSLTLELIQSEKKADAENKVLALHKLSDFFSTPLFNIKFEYKMQKKHKEHLKQLVNAMNQLDNRYSLDLSLSSTSITRICPVEIQNGLAVDLIKTAFKLNEFTLTYNANVGNETIIEELLNTNLSQQFILSSLAIDKLIIPVEYTIRRHQLQFLWEL